MKLRVVALLAALFMAAVPAAHAQQGGPPPAPPWHDKTGLVFPDQAGGAKLTRSIDYAKLAGDPRLGYSWHYLIPNLVVASIYVYDGGQRVPDGTDNAVVAAQFEQNKAEIFQAATQANRYRDLRPVGDITTCRYGAFAFRCQTFSAVQIASNQAVLTRLMLMGYRAHFVKLRIDWPQNSASGDAEVERLVRALFSQ